MDHAYTMSGSQELSSNTQASSVIVDEEGDVDEPEDVCENDANNVYDANQDDNSMDCSQDERMDHIFSCAADEIHSDLPTQIFSVLIPTEEWMQMLPPQYLLHYIRERTVFRDAGKASREGRESTAPLKRGWLQGAWRETFKEAIAKQTGIPCVINFTTSNFLKQPFSRKVGPPLWRVRACCRQDDGQCLKFSLKVQDFHPSKPQVEIIVAAHGTLLEGQEGEERHTITASDHMKAIKSLQRYNATTSQTSPDGLEVEDSLLEDDTLEVQRLKLAMPTRDWISFLPAEAAEAYVLERSNMPKDRLALEGQDAWAKGLRHFVPRVTKECRQYLKRALAERTGLPCRIGLTGRCHLKPPFSRKKRAPLFVTNGFCGRKDLKCLRFRFTVQDFNPQAPFVTVDVEIRGRLLSGPEGEERHSRRPADDLAAFPARGTKRAASGGDARAKKQRRNSRKGPAAEGDAVDEAADEAADETADEAAGPYEALQTESWPEEFDLNSAEVILDDGKRAEFAAADEAVNTIQVMSDVNGAESALGEDAARELVQLANEALSLAGGGTAADGSAHPQLTATKIVQSGDQVFIFVSDPNEAQNGEGATIEAVEVNCDELAAENAAEQTEMGDAAGGMVHAVDEQGSLVEYLLPQGEPEPEPEPEQDSPCMEYRWQLQVPIADWLKLLPPKSLRYYIHERTVGREVWVEEGWERQFRNQTLQHGWRDLIRRAVVEQTDIPCQVCFRGRSSLKLPFSRKHAAALWRTQGYCARGDRNCLIYKFCVQDFHPDDEAVNVEVKAVGRLNRECRRWFHGEGTPVDMDSVTKYWPPEMEVDGDTQDTDAQEDEDPVAALLRVKQEPDEEAGDDWEEEDGPVVDGAEAEQEQPEEAEEETRVSTTQVVASEVAKEAAVPTGEVVQTSGEEMYEAVIKSLTSFKANLHTARRCPLKMQAALRLVRSADSMAGAPCRTPDCLCRPQRLKMKPRPRPRAQQDEEQAAELAARAPLRPSPDTRLQPVHPTSPPPLRPCGTPRPAAGALPSQRTPPRATPTLGSPVKSPDAMWQKVTRAGPVVLTAIKQQPSIIRLSPAQIAANARGGGTLPSTPTSAASATVAVSEPGSLTPRSYSKLVSLSSAIVRSAVLTPSIIKPSRVATQSGDATPRRGGSGGPLAASTPASSKPPVSQSVVSSSQDGGSRAVSEDARGREVQAQDNDPSWIVDEMRSVILGGEGEGQKRGATSKNAVKAPIQAPANLPQKPTTRPVVDKPAVRTTVRPAVRPVVKPAAKPAAKPATSPALAKPADQTVTKKVTVAMAKIEAASLVADAVSPSRGLSTRVMVKKVGQKVTADDLPLVERALRSLKEEAAAEETASQPRPPTTKTVFAPSRPVTRGVAKMVVSTASTSNPPPLVPISKGPVKTQAPLAAPQAAPPGGRGSRVSLASTTKPLDSTTVAQTPPPQPAKASPKTVPTKVTSSVKALFPKGKVLILKPSDTPMLRSSPRRPL